MLLHKLEDLAQVAGDAVLEIYRHGQIDVQTKDDASPVTQADILANDMICRGLRQLSSLPIISEETGSDPLGPGVVANSYWLIDPIDGTKEFIAKKPTFTINIALIENGVPVAGVVYAPDRQELYAGADAVFRINRQPFKPQWAEARVVMCSASRPEKQFDSFLANNGQPAVMKIGSSIKFCLVAKGEAHFYPRYSPLSAWDIAAGHAVARAAGCELIEMKTGLPMRYEYQRRWNPAFVLQAPGCAAIL